MREPSAQQPGRVVSWLLDRATREAEVQNVEVVAPNLRLVTFIGEPLRGAKWTPGDMVQIILSGSTLLGPWEMRSYTPLMVDREQGTMQILAVVHGSAPGSDWFASAHIGKRCRFAGPRHALSLMKPQRPMIFFGDETSFGTAVALRATQLGSGGLQFIFEVGSVEESRAILTRFGIAEAVRFVSRQANDRHLDTLEREVIELYRSSAALSLVLTGRAPSIQRIYSALRAAGVSRWQVTNVPYWAPGKKGLKEH